MHNRAEYLPIVHGLSVGSFVHVNVNYRYRDHEIATILRDADAKAIVFDEHSSEDVRGAMALLDISVPAVHVGPGERWAESFDAIVDERREPFPSRPSGDDLFLVYTGGTTGTPKGVMWRQHDVVGAMTRRVFGPDALPLPDDFDASWLERVSTTSAIVGLAASPMVHGTALLRSLGWLVGGGQVVTVGGRRSDPAAILDAVDRHGVEEISVVGDVFARPLLDLITAHPGRWSLATLRCISSAGVVWSPAVKRQLIERIENLTLVDSLGASEALGMALATTTTQHPETDFVLGATACVLDDETRPMDPPCTGRVAVRGHVPLGYLNHPERSAITFPIIDGVRHSAPGDIVSVDAEGRVTLLGRGSACINTGGEKVFPEEVEAIVLMHPAVTDAVVVGTPDEHMGEMVTAVVALRPGAEVDTDEMREFVKAHLAGYKAPRRLVVVDAIARQPHGKADYAAMRDAALAHIAATAVKAGRDTTNTTNTTNTTSATSATPT
jgi:3-oxocholest-4-en-26-oate---CoA ligase